jgi:hypothetical protein
VGAGALGIPPAAIRETIARFGAEVLPRFDASSGARTG